MVPPSLGGAVFSVMAPHSSDMISLGGTAFTIYVEPPLSSVLYLGGTASSTAAEPPSWDTHFSGDTTSPSLSGTSLIWVRLEPYPASFSCNFCPSRQKLATRFRDSVLSLALSGYVGGYIHPVNVTPEC